MTEQRFTDDRLRILKNVELKQTAQIILSHSEIEAWINRLEAAENCRESLDDLLHHGVEWPNGVIHEADPELAKERLEAWRKAAGRD